VKVLIKLGGTLLDDPAGLQAVAWQLSKVADGCELAVVHGGGKQVTRFLEERGVTSRFVGGLRVSDEAVIDAVTKVIAGTVNKQLVAALIAAGRAAVGISGVDGTLTSAVQLAPELGFVGKPVKTEGRLLDLLLKGGYTPVVACIAGDDRGGVFNVNADQMAVSCALGWQADKLFFLTDVAGVKNAAGDVIQDLTPADVSELIASGVAKGGMQAKLDAALTALHGGLSEVTIALGRESNICARLLAGDPVGTRLSFATALNDPTLSDPASNDPALKASEK
jgi:acetylglutamate kinase